MNAITGNLIELALRGEFDVVVHGCNCHCAMGAGIARQLADRFPEVPAADDATTPGDRAKLGTLTLAPVERSGARFTVVNAYTQFDHSGPPPLVEYDALRRCFAAIGHRFSGLRIGYPRIGAGLAGGDWDRIAAIIDRELDGQDHTLVEFG